MSEFTNPTTVVFYWFDAMRLDERRQANSHGRDGERGNH